MTKHFLGNSSGMMRILCFVLILLRQQLCFGVEPEVTSEFLDACTEGNLEVLQETLRIHPTWVNGRSPEGETCLHVAAIMGHPETTALILKKGGDPNIRTTFADGLRMHPLSWNVYGGHVETARVLLQHGAQVNADFDHLVKENGRTKPITVLDMVSDVIGTDAGSKEPSPHLQKYYQMRDLLLEHDAKRYSDLQKNQEL
jgi:hypothetical protein